MIHVSHNRIVTFMLVLALCIFPFGNLLRFQIAPTVSIVLLDCIVALIVCFSFPTLWEMKNELTQNTSFRILLTVYGVGFTGLLVNTTWLNPQSFFVSFLYGLRFGIYAALLMVSMYLDRSQKKFVFNGLLISGCVMAAAGIVQYFFFPDLRGFFSLGWDEHLYRLFGTLFDPNFSGAIFVITSLLGVERYWGEKKHVFLSVISFALPSVALLLTYSRSSYLMAVMAVFAYFTMKRAYNYAALSILIIILGVVLLPKNLRSEGVDLLRTASIEARAHEYSQAVDIFAHHPVVGVGFNAYRYAQLKNGDIAGLTDQPDHAGAGVPNSFLFMLATTGFVGTILFLSFLMTQLRLALRNQNALVVACICALCVHALFENTLFYPFIMFQYMMLFGMQSRT